MSLQGTSQTGPNQPPEGLASSPLSLALPLSSDSPASSKGRDRYLVCSEELTSDSQEGVIESVVRLRCPTSASRNDIRFSVMFE